MLPANCDYTSAIYPNLPPVQGPGAHAGGLLLGTGPTPPMVRTHFLLYVPLVTRWLRLPSYVRQVVWFLLTADRFALK